MDLPLLASISPLAERISRAYYAIGQAHGLLKEAGDCEPVYALTGKLYVSSSGWALLTVPNSIVRGLFDAAHVPGLELPLKDGVLTAHISVMTDSEIAKIGGPEKLTERGHQFRYQLGPVVRVRPDGWDDVSWAYLVQVRSPELKALRRSYGLTDLPHGDHELHLTWGVVRKHTLKPGPTSKAGADLVGKEGESDGIFARQRDRNGVDLESGLDHDLEELRPEQGVGRDPGAVPDGPFGDLGRRKAGAEAVRDHPGPLDAGRLAGRHGAGGGPDPDGARRAEDPDPWDGRRMLVRLAGEKSAGVTPSAQRSAVLITGNPGYVRANPTVESFYRDIEAELERLGFSTTRDPGEPHTMPPTADLWVGHSRGVDRFRFAPEDQARVAFGAEGGVNHPEDKAWQRGQVPGEQHFIFTDAMREALARHGKESSGLTKSSVEDKLHGGAADGLPDSEFSPSALAKGEEHEREHTDDTEIAREIAKDHLEGEGEDYYDRLDRIEKDSVAGWFAGF